MPEADLRERLIAAGIEAGLVAVGVTDAEPLSAAREVIEQRKDEGLHAGMQFTYRNPARSTEPARILDGAKSIVAGALRYGTVEPEPTRQRAEPSRANPEPAHQSPETDRDAGEPHARVARYAAVDHYSELRRCLDVVAEVLRSDGYKTRVVADDNALVDRAVAHRAGLGWFGKNTNLLVPGVGSWVVLGAVVTDAELAPNSAPVPDGCGPCQRCLPSCPTGALVAPGVLDARRCLAWLVQAEGVFPREWREALGDRVYGCDDCQEVCPPSKSATPVRLGHGLASPVSWVAVLEMLAASDEELLERHGRWYVPRRDPRYLRRNALVVLGNTADGADPQVRSVLTGYLDHPDELLRAQAVWSARRLGCGELIDAVRDPHAPLVDDELRAPSPSAR